MPRSFFHTDLPLVQAPMAGAQGAALALAVGSVGALGSLPCAMLSPAALRDELAALRAAGPQRAWNLNFFCHAEPVADPAREERWRRRLAAYHAEHGTEPGPPGGARAPFSDALADLVEEGAPAGMPRVVSFHFGLPSAALVDRVKAWGAQVWSSATTVAEARWLEDHGADAVIAQGLEAGGHRGHFLPHRTGQVPADATDTAPAMGSAEPFDPADPTTLWAQSGLFSLLPQVVDAVSVPVVAAGGIASAQGVAAARALGASAVQVGTAYLLCPECSISPVHRAALRRAREHPGQRRTALTNVFTGRPARGLVNRLMQDLGGLCADAPAFPLAGAALAPLRAAAERDGLGDFSPLWAGQNVGGCDEIPAADLTRRLAAGW